MPAPHYTLVLTGGIDRLSDALGSGYTAPASSRDERCHLLLMHADPANTHVIYVGGGNATLSAANYGNRIEAPVSTIPPAPTPADLGARQVRPSDIYVLGTAGEILHFQLFGTAG